MMQSIAGQPPEYSLEYYRLFFIEAGSAKATLDNWNLTVYPGDIVPLSPGEKAMFDGVLTVRSILLQAAEHKMMQLSQEDGSEVTAAPISELVLRFQDLLEAYFLDHKDISFYSDSLNMTPTVLNRYLKSELGQTALQAINERIAIAARVELRSGRKSVKEVAFDLGFEDPLYFSRFFKKQFGHSPSHYFSNPPLQKK